VFFATKSEDKAVIVESRDPGALFDFVTDMYYCLCVYLLILVSRDMEFPFGNCFIVTAMTTM
jgi:hypothetical protein